MNPDPFIKKIRTIHAPTCCLYCKYINYKKIIAGGFMDGSISLYNAKTMKAEVCLTDSETASINNSVTYIAHELHNSNLITCAYSGGLVKIWDYYTGQCLYTINEKRQTYGIVFHPKKQKFFTYGDDGKVNLYDVETKRKEFIYQKSQRMLLDGHVSKIFAFRFNPAHPNEFLTGGWDNTLYFWDVRCQNAVRYISDIFMGGDGIVVNQQGTELITCEWKRDDPLKKWDYRNGTLIQVITPDMEKCHLYCGTYLNDKMFAVGGSDENLFRIVSLRANSTLSVIKNLPGGVYCIDTTEYGTKFAPGTLGIKLDEFADLPIILICSGKNIYEIRYR